MLIANPIYDAVFKFMMDDHKVAKLLLSAIIGEEIVKLDLRPTELKIKIKESLTVYHIDFVAKIRTSDKKEKIVIIEVQKAKFATDIMRFRKYLGEQYINPNNVQKVNEDQEQYGKALPIISIYFLGHKLEYAKAPVIKVQRKYIDVTTGKIIKEKEDFIESLTHDSFIIQITYLSKNRKTDLLKVLSIFDQSNRQKNFHILNVKEEVFPEKYRHIIRRLQMAQEDEEVMNYMEAEDFYLDDLKNRERLIATLNKNIEEKNTVIEEKAKIIEEKAKTIEEKVKTIEENKKTIEESKITIEENKKILFNTVITMLKAKIDINTIAKSTGLSKKDIEKLNCNA